MFFSGFKVICKPAIKLTKRGRRSGGVICLIKNEHVPYIKHIEIHNQCNFCICVIDKLLFGTEKDVLYVCAYVPPEGSPFYKHFDFDNGISCLEDCLADFVLGNDVHIIVTGDLNSRTSNISQHLFFDDMDYDHHKTLSLFRKRCSQDVHLNNYGKLLLNMCTTFDLSILNGICNGDLQGCYTYISDAGCSVTDYFLFSNDLLSLVYDSCDFCVEEKNRF